MRPQVESAFWLCALTQTRRCPAEGAGLRAEEALQEEGSGRGGPEACVPPELLVDRGASGSATSAQVVGTVGGP